MDKGEVLLYVIAIVVSVLYICIFKKIDKLYFILISVYMGLGYLILGYLERKKQRFK